MNKKIIYIISIVLFAAVLVLPSALWLFADKTEVSQGETTGLEEKRELAGFPKKFSGNLYFAEIEAYYKDHAPFRSKLIALETAVSQSYETYYRKNISPKLTTLLVKNANKPKPTDSSATPTPTIDYGNLWATPTPTTTPVPTVEPTPVPTPSPKPTPTMIPVTLPPNVTPSPSPKPTPSPVPTKPPCQHMYIQNKVIKEATCDGVGQAEFVCSKCSDIIVKEVNALGHTYKLVKTSVASYDFMGYKLYKCSRCGNAYASDIVNKLIDDSYLAPQIKNNVVYGRRDWLFYTGDNSIGYYTGENVLSTNEMASWKNTLESLDDVCNKKGIKLAVLVAPNKEIMYPEYMPTYNIVNNPKRGQVLLDYMQKNSTVKYVYPYNDLLKGKLYWDVFYKQDTHWNGIGGLFGTMAVYSALGLPTVNPLTLDIKDVSRKGGDLSNFCGFSSSYKDFAVAYKEDVQTQCERIPGSTIGSTELPKYTSNSSNPAKVVVLGDSFRHAMAGYLSKDFSMALMAHRGDIYHEEVLKCLHELTEGDVLIVLAVERYDSAILTTAAQLTDILK